MSARFGGRLGLQQRVLPGYRVPFFDMLAEACAGGVSVFAGQPRAHEGIDEGRLQMAGQVKARNIHILSGPLYLCEQRGLPEWLAAWDPAVLIVEANPRYLATASAVRWMHERERPVIGWGLGAPAPRGAFSRLWQSIRGRFLQQFDALIAYSQRGAAEYAETGFPRDQIFVATNAAVAGPTGSPPSQRKATSEQPHILFVGRLQRRKRVDLLLRACAEMPPPGPQLAIVGDGPERKTLETLARQIFPSAEFAGRRHGEELTPYFEGADLLVLPGTGGLAVQEAMSYGLPVIVARGDGTQDDLVRSENGWQVPPEDYAALVAAVKAAISDVPRLRKMGQESRRIVSEEINLEKMVESFLRAIRSVEQESPTDHEAE
jgi:glycosyltransferase involved in cell wall biosynthesis